MYKERRIQVTTTKIGIERIGQIAINVQDLSRAVAFYRDVLGLDFLFQTNGLAFFDCDGTRLMLSRPETKEFDHPGSVIYFQVPDIHYAYQNLKENGVTLIDEPHFIAKLDTTEIWMVFFKDSEGNTLAFQSEI
jgi:predicted enzyme related to lactoylglutathione lyase